MQNAIEKKFQLVLDALGTFESKPVRLDAIVESESSVAFRYDIHRRDIEGAWHFVEVHSGKNIPATFFLQLDYAAPERQALEKFVALGRRVLDAGLQVGLHLSPADSYFIWHKFGGVPKKFGDWLRTDAPSYFAEVAGDAAMSRDLNREIERHFLKLCTDAKAIFPEMTLLSSHGGEIGQILLAKGNTLPTAVADFVAEFRPNRWMTEERIERAGFVGEVEQNRTHLRQYTDLGKGSELLLKQMQGAAARPGKSFQLLMHPYGWTVESEVKSVPTSIQSAAAIVPQPTDVELPFTELDFHTPDECCGARCGVVYDKWTGWFPKAFKCEEVVHGAARYTVPKVPLAVLDTRQSDEAYRKLIGDKSRNMIRKAEKNGYEVRPFQSSDYLDDITAIRTSKPIRSGKPVPESFKEPAKAFDTGNQNFCDHHKVVAIGVFRKETDTLVAYVALHNCGDLSIVNTILGHGDHLNFGVMNLLIYGAYKAIRDGFPSVKHINYLTLHSSTKELDRFKKSVGFEPHNFGMKAGAKTVEAPPAAPAPQAIAVPVFVKSIEAEGNKLRDLIEGRTLKKVLIRGDCCASRAIRQNTELLGRPEVIQSEKCTMQVYMDHLNGISYPDEKMLAISDIERMSPSLKRYYERQNKADVLHEKEADLLVIDSYADSFFQIWQNKVSKAKLWVNAKFLYDRPGFEREHVKLPWPTFHEVLVDTMKFIEAVRVNNPGIPVLYLTHPIHYYKYLNKRREFCYLGEEIERFMPDVYWGTNLPKEECDPVDMDSCGPGETHHYAPATYAKMINAAAGRNPVRTMAPVVW